MKQVKISDEEARRTALRAMLRQKTGINPDAINRAVIEITRTVNTIRDLASELEGGAFLTPLSKHAQSATGDMIGMRCKIVFTIVAMYEKCLPKNVKLPGPDLFEKMDEKVGLDGFDITIIEDGIIDLFPKLNDMALEQLLEKAHTMLPPHLEGRPIHAKDVLNGETLILHASWLQFDEAIETIGKLSRIVLLGEEASTVQGCKLRQPTSQQSCTDVRMVKGEPVREIRYRSHGSDLIEAVYETHEQARKVAKTLIARKEEPDATA